MKLSDQITRRQLFVAFGMAQQSGGLTSVDLAATRDGSRVILTASDGSAAPMDPADATLAGVMTAADKTKLDGLSPGRARSFTSRSEISAETVGAEVTQLQTAGYWAAGDGGAAVYARVGTEPAHALKVQSADGAWWELSPRSGEVDVRQAGAVGDNVTDDSQAFLDALAGVEDFNTAGVNSAVHAVRVSPGAYYLGATTLELKKAVRLSGSGSGRSGRKPAKLRWDANVTGIIVHREDTTGATTESPGTGAGDSSTIEGLHLVSDGGSIANITDDTKGHGIWMRARAVLRDLLIEDFPGNGVHILAVQTGDAATKGNANLWRIDTCSAAGCHLSGLYVKGADANAGVATGFDARNNGRAGIWDSSFLGNTYVACHVDGNGYAGKGGNAADQSYYIHYNGAGNGNSDRRYVAAVGASEADLVGTEPGTDAAVWIDVDAGPSSSSVPTWESGKPEGTYFVGGSVLTDNNNAQNIILNCYSENGYAQYTLPTLVFGGINQHTNSLGTFGGMIAGVTDVKLPGPIETAAPFTVKYEDPRIILEDTLGTGSDGQAIIQYRLGRFHFNAPSSDPKIRFGAGSTGGSDLSEFKVQIGGALKDIVAGTRTSGANQAALTNSTGGTRDGTLAAVSGSGADATINDNFTELHALLDEVRTALVAFGIMKGSA